MEDFLDNIDGKKSLKVLEETEQEEENQQVPQIT